MNKKTMKHRRLIAYQLPWILLTWGFMLTGFSASAQDEIADIPPVQTGGGDEIALEDMSLEDLMNMSVVTASNKSESLSKAPATIIVITEADIKERGYIELFDVLNDLPGFDLSRAFGDDDYYAYVRGYRKTTSDQMLLMIDGIVMNHLYNNNMNAYSQYPLQNVKQIEVVYGPASAIYGPNAFSGVINIITRDDGKSVITASTGQNNTNIIDLFVSKKMDDLSVDVTGRIYQSNGYDFSGRTALMEDTLFRNPYYWGDLAETNFMGYNSPSNDNFLHPRISYKGLTLGSINFFHESGLGSEFAGGTSLNAGTWQFKEQTNYVKYEVTKDKLNSKTLFKLRRSDIPGSSTFLWRWPSMGVDTNTLNPGDYMVMNGMDTVFNTTADTQTYITDQNTIYADYWQANNSSAAFYQDFTYDASEKLTINFGIKYKRRNLNRDYVINTNTSSADYVYLLADVDRNNPLNPAVTGSMDFPARPDDATLDQENHNVLVDKGIYSQVKYMPSDKLSIFAGLRLDHNSVWKEVFSPRIGVVAQPTENLTAKAFFGTAFLEPSARILYGGWAGSLSNADLRPERMRTGEVTLRYTKDKLSFGVNGFYNIAPDAIGKNSKKVPINLGERRMIGVELNARMLMIEEGKTLSRLKGDLFLSYINSTEDLKGTGDFIETGNMAPIKFKLMLSGRIKNNLNISLQNRYISQINTVSSNPLGTIGAYFVTDAFIEYDNVLTEGLSIGLKIYNLMDQDYFHPGYRSADAGETTVDYALNTSWYSSRLPQPGRTVMARLRFQF